MIKKVTSRREFLEHLGKLGGFGAVYCSMAQLGFLPPVQAYTGPPVLKDRIGEGRHIVILGAGVSGLCAAYLLRNTRFKVTIIEPNSWLGGRCRTLRRGDIVQEQGADSRGVPFKPGTCGFDEGPDFYFEAGPGRIPQNHRAVLSYCKRLKVKLQPYIFACRSNLLQNDNFNQGTPVPLRWIKHDLRGHIAELLTHSLQLSQIDQFVEPGNRKALMDMLQHFGNLRKTNQSLEYKGTSRGGYKQKPGAGMQAGLLRSPFDLDELLESEIWKTGLFNDMYLYWQSSLMQAEGGMDNIPKAFHRSLGPNTQIHLNVKAIGIRQTADKIIVRHSKSDNPIEADFCISTMAPPLLSRMLDPSFPQGFRTALANVIMVAACKIGWQARSRFWEEENEIYGGISWTNHIIKQIWYPSQGIHSRKGILTGAYIYGKAANAFGQMSHKERMTKALQGGEKLHPGMFRQNIENGISIAWQNMPNLTGGWAYHRDQAQNTDYLAINKPQGRLVLAGDYFSFLSGWMEGAVRSAELAVKRISKMSET